jgi:hypothetical protein
MRAVAKAYQDRSLQTFQVGAGWLAGARLRQGQGQGGGEGGGGPRPQDRTLPLQARARGGRRGAPLLDNAPPGSWARAQARPEGLVVPLPWTSARVRCVAEHQAPAPYHCSPGRCGPGTRGPHTTHDTRHTPLPRCPAAGGAVLVQGTAGGRRDRALAPVRALHHAGGAEPGAPQALAPLPARAPRPHVAPSGIEAEGSVRGCGCGRACACAGDRPGRAGCCRPVPRAGRVPMAGVARPHPRAGAPHRALLARRDLPHRQAHQPAAGRGGAAAVAGGGDAAGPGPFGCPPVAPP